jgi:hypothetical protein
VKELNQMQRQIRWLTYALITLSCVCAVCLTMATILLVEKPVRAAAEARKLTVRRLAVIDDKGIERVVISAPAPDPIVRGKREKRSGAASGILIYDRDGNERGGYLSDDTSNGAMLTLDGIDSQVFTVYANDSNGATLSLNNQRGDGVTLTTWNRPVVQMRQGKTIIYKQPPDAPDLH